MGSLGEYLAEPKPAPDLNIPLGSTVKVSIINSTSALEVPLGDFMGPVQPGHETLNGPAFSFLIEHSSGRKLLFDLGCRKDWRQFPPAVLDIVTQPGWKIEVEKGVAQILQENGIDAAGGAIEGIIWSHWHYDHIGDPATFPGSTNLIVGPGLKEAFLPAYPANPESPLRESDFEGRELKVIDFESSTLKVGGFRAVDYFGDGSFYLLDSPGHAIGHICALARTTSEDAGTFIFMGGDAAHHGAEFRPTEYLPLPKEISPWPAAGYKITSPALKGWKGFCPGHVFEDIHPKKCANEPYYHINKAFPYNFDQAVKTVEAMEEFDAADNVFVVIAYDGSLLAKEVGVTWFPDGTINDWRKKDIGKNARWGFLKDFEHAAETAQGS